MKSFLFPIPEGASMGYFDRVSTDSFNDDPLVGYLLRYEDYVNGNLVEIWGINNENGDVLLQKQTEWGQLGAQISNPLPD